MNGHARSLIYLAAAVGVHTLLLFGVRFGGAAFISDAESGPESMEVALVENAEEAGEELSAPEMEPPQPEPPPQVEPPPEPESSPPVEPLKPELPLPDPVPLEPVKPEMTTPEPEPVAPKPEPPKPKPVPRPAVKPVAKPSGPRPQLKPSPSTAGLGSPNGAPDAPAGRPGAGDNGHASWRNKVRPSYPEAARAARISGSVHIQVNVNALGQATSMRVVRSSGSPMLDEAALRSVRASSFNPKRLAGIPMSDTIIVPITFRLDR